MFNNFQLKINFKGFRFKMQHVINIHFYTKKMNKRDKVLCPRFILNKAILHILLKKQQQKMLLIKISKYSNSL